MSSLGLKLNLEVPADAMRDNLMRALDAVTGRSGWLGTRPSVWQSGNVAVSHAGGCPLTPLSAQSDQDLRWGHPSFPANQRKDGLWMVHGHYITDRPKVNGRHIGIDTGAYMTGKLTAARVSHGEVEFIST